MRLNMLPSAFATASAPGLYSYAAQWLACELPCRRFAFILADDGARLGANVVRYSFIVSLPAGRGDRARSSGRNERSLFQS